LGLSSEYLLVVSLKNRAFRTLRWIFIGALLGWPIYGSARIIVVPEDWRDYLLTALAGIFFAAMIHI